MTLKESPPASRFRPHISWIRSAMALSLIVSVATSAGQARAPHAAQTGPATASARNPEAMLFVLNPNAGFLGFAGPEALHAPAAEPTTKLAMSSQTVLSPRDVALDGQGALYFVSSSLGGSIAVYDNPLLATGSREPDRRVSGKATGLARPIGIAIDPEKALLYVLLKSSVTQPSVLVFDIKSREAFHGEALPLRSFTLNVHLLNAQQVRFAQGSLYVANQRGESSEILVLDQPEKLRGRVSADRVLTSPDLKGAIRFDVDGKDRLLVSRADAGEVQIYADASKLEGAVHPQVTMTIAGETGKPRPAFAVTDDKDRLYVSDPFHCKIYVFDECGKLTSGSHFPDRSIGTRGSMAPERLLLLEGS